MDERIKVLRKQLKLTQQEFAERIGIKAGAISNYEIGRNEPVDSVIALICREFRVSEEWLREGTGEMFVALTDEEELMELFAVSAGDQSEIAAKKRALVRVILRLGAESVSALADIAEAWAEEMKKEQQD